MTSKPQFPFGQPLKCVEQLDRTPKRVFVLGVYASAVHARWISPDGKDRVRALAVASEPYIFWRGDGVEQIIRQIHVPQALGRLVPSDPRLNGPSGNALDELILKPLGYCRDEAWLCDLVPYSCVNPAQHAAIDRAYLPLVERHGLPKPNIPPVPKKLADEQRVQAIAAELQESQADTIVLLGDHPIKSFLRVFDRRWRNLSDFGSDRGSYGRRQRASIAGRDIDVVAVAHPRQVGKLGTFSARWHQLHADWISDSGNLF